MIPKVFGSFRSLVAAALVAGATAFAPVGASAQDWSGQVTVYGWGAGVFGDYSPTPGQSLSFDKSLSEVLENLDAAFFLTGLARRGDLVLFGDLTYSKSSRTATLPPVTPLRPGTTISGEITMSSLTLAAGQRIDAGGGTTVDLMGGLRAWKLEGLLSTNAPNISFSSSKSFVDPIIAMRVHSPLSDRWSVLGYLDFGGFGVGSDFTWQAAVTANYQMRNNTYLSLGWRHLSVDYAEGNSTFKGGMSGPLVGLTWQF